MPIKRCVIIYNPKSGRNHHKYWKKKILKILKKYHYQLEIKYTEYKGHAINIVKNLNDNIDLVIAAGGDGTLNEVVKGNLQRKIKLLIAPLPLGTNNDVSSMYGLTKRNPKNLENLLKGKEKNIDICSINSVPFVYVACFGKFVDIAYKTPRKLKEKYGNLGYFIYGLKHLKGKVKPYHIVYEVDGKHYEGDYTFIFITNSTRIAGISNIYQDVLLDDNQFEVALFNIQNSKNLLKAVYHIAHGKIGKIPGLEYFKTNDFKVIFKEENIYSWCIDGEEYPTINKTFHFTIPYKIKILVPNIKINKLFE